MKFYTPQQCTDCGDTCDSFPKLSFAQICKSYHAGGEFKSDFDAAKARKMAIKEAQSRQEAVPLPAFQQAAVNQFHGCGVKVSAFFKFCPEDEYVQSFGIAAPVARLVPLLLEDNTTVERGVLIRRTRGDSPEVRHMRDVELYRYHDNVQQTKLLDFLESLRGDEASDTLESAHKKELDTHVSARCLCSGEGGGREIALRESFYAFQRSCVYCVCVCVVFGFDS